MGIKTNAQVATKYSFAQTTGAYASQASGATILSTSFYEQNLTTSLPFAFNYNGTTYASGTTVIVNSGGFITFGTAPATGSYVDGISASGSAVISGFGQDLISQSAPGTFNARYSANSQQLTLRSGTYPNIGSTLTNTTNTSDFSGVLTVTAVNTTTNIITVSGGNVGTTARNINQSITFTSAPSSIIVNTIGTTPNRKLYIEWINADAVAGGTSYTGSLLNFQIVLNENTGTNSNIINVNYGTCTPGPDYQLVTVTPLPAVGLKGASNTDFNDRTGTNWAASTAGAANSSTMTMSSTVFPASGQIYTFTPPLPTIAINAGNSQTATAGSTVSILPSVIVKDGYGNLLSGVNVTFTVASGGGSVTGASATTNSSGIATVGSWTLGTTAGTNTITATATGYAGSPLTFTATGTAGAASKLSVTSQPTTGISNTSLTPSLVITVQDANGNTVTGSTATVNVAIASGTGTLSGTTSVNAVSGVATFSTLKLDKATTYTLTASSTSPTTLTSATTGNIVISAGTASKLVVTGQPTTGTAATALSPSLVITVQDAAGNTVTGSSATVNVAIASGTGTLSGTTSVNASSGVTTFSNLILDKATTYTLTASSTVPTTLTSATTGNIVISAGTPSKYVVTSSNYSPVAGSSVTITAQLTDAGGNPASVSGNIVTWSNTGSGGSFGSPTSTTNASGIATVTFTTGTIVGTYTVTGTDGGSLTGTTPAINTIAGAASKLSVTSQPTTGTSGVALSPSLVITVQDANGNTVTGSTATVNVAIASGTGTLSGTASVNAVSGVATFSTLKLDKATTYTLTASSTSPTTLTSATTGNIVISAGAASKLVVTSQPTTGTSGIPLTPSLVITVQDAAGNTVTGSSATINIAIATGTGTLSGTTSATASSGVATFSNLILDKATTYTLTASSTVPATLTSATTANVVISAGSATKYVVTSNNYAPVAGASVTITAQLTDAAGNNLSISGATVTWSNTGSGTGGSFSNPTSTVTSGVATITFTTGTISNSVYAIKAVDGSSLTGTSPNITTIAGAASKLSVTSQPTTGTSGVALSPSLVITVQDANGNTVTGSTATVNVAIASGTGTLSGTASVNAVSGVATFSTLKLDKATTYTLTASSTSPTTLTSATTGNIVISAGAASKLVVTSQPTTGTSGIPLTPSLVITVQDAAGNTVTGSSATINIAIATGTGTLSGTTSATASSGVATFSNLILDKATTYTLTASSTVPATLTSATTGNIVISAGTASQLVITTQPAGPSANGGVLVTIPVVKVEDAGGNIVTGPSVSITAAATGASWTIAGTTNPLSSSSGVATFTGTTATNNTTSNITTATITFSATGLTSAVSTTFSIPGPPLTGDYLVGSGKTYTTITAAVADLTSRGVSGAVRFLLTDATYSSETFPITIPAYTGASATNTVTIKPNTGVAASISGSSSTAIIVLNGTQYVTIDGTNGSTANSVCPASTATRNLTITNTSAGITSAIIWLQTVATSVANNTIQNCILNGSGNTQTLFGVGSGSATISTTSLGTGNNNNSYINNSISKTQYGIYSFGASAASKNTGTIINQNQLNTASPNNIQFCGIYVGFENNITIAGNTVSNLTTTNSLAGIALGLSPITSNASTLTTGSDVTNATVTNNIIGSVASTSSTGYSAFGIEIAGVTTGTNLIANNMISGVSAPSTPSDIAAGIFIGGATGSTTKIYYNTVSMTGTRGAATNSSFALAITGSTPTVDIRNNILVNSQTSTGTGGSSYAIGLAYTSTTGNYANLTSNNNDLFTSGANGKFCRVGGLSQATGTDETTQTIWNTATGKDPLTGATASKNVQPSFILTTPTDLHLTTTNTTNINNLYGTGTLGTGILQDIDCGARSTTFPDMGADEFIVVPAITSFTSNNPNGTTNGYAGSTITITGTGFTGATAVFFGGTAATSFVVNSPTQITAIVAGGTSGSVSVTAPGGSASLAGFSFLGYITTAAGDWNTPVTWLGGVVPPTGAITTIANLITINNPASDGITAAASYSPISITVNASQKITFGTSGSISTKTLTNSGIIDMTSGGTLNIAASGTLTNNATTFIGGTGEVNFAGTGTVNGTKSATFNNVTANGGVTLPTGTTQSTINGNLLLNVGGTVSSAPNYGSVSTLTYNEGGTVNVGNEWPAALAAPTNVTLQNATTVALGSAIRIVSGVLTFTSGFITNVSPGALDIYYSGSVIGGGTGGWVIGTMAKSTTNNANPTFTYTVGSNTTSYTPLTLNFSGNTTASGAGAVLVSTIGTDDPSISSSTINSTKSVNRYWTVTNYYSNPITLASGVNIKPSFTWVSGDVDAGTSAAGLIVGEYDGSTWTYPAVGTPTSTTLAVTGGTITTFNSGPNVNYQFQIGDGCAASSNTGISYTGSPYCMSSGTQTVTLTNNSGVTGTFSATPSGLSINSGSGTITPGLTSANSYTVSYAIPMSGQCAAYSATTPIVINPNASVGSVSGTSPLCIAGTATYTANSVVLGGSGTGAWSSSNTAVATVNASSGLVTAVGAGTANIIYTVTGGCGGTATAQQSVTVNPNASVGSVTGTSPLCIGGTATYTANAVVLGGSGTGAWSSDNTAVATVNASTGLVTAVGAGTANIIYTVTGGCGGTASAQQSLTVTTPPSATISYSGSPYCTSGGTATVTMSGTTGGTYSSTTGLVIDGPSGDVNLSSSTAGTYTVIYTVAAAGGCAVYTTTTSITIAAAASATINYYGSPYCPGTGTASVTQTGTTGGTYTSTTGLSINSTTGAVDLSLSTSGTYTVTYSVSPATGCSGVYTTTAMLTIGVDTWTGVTSTDWNDGTNWSCGHVPSINSDAVIPAGTPYSPSVAVAGPAATVHNLTINSGASLTVTSQTLQVSDSIINNGSFDVSIGTIELNGRAPQFIPAGAFTGNKIRNLVISNNVSLNGTDSLTGNLSFGASLDTFSTNGNLTLRSTASRTGSVGIIANGNAISGNVTVERYIATGPGTLPSDHAKSWELLAVPTMGQTINQSWMEGATASNVALQGAGASNPKPGYGTMITSNVANAATFPTPGFDAYTAPGPTVKAYNYATNSYVGPATTGAAVYDQRGWFTFVRGDRSVYTASGAGSTADHTILRTTGTLITPAVSQPVSTVPAGYFQSVGNPFASPVDMTRISATGGMINQYIYVWDPRVGGNYNYGAFVTLQYDGTNYRVQTNGGYSYPANDTVYNYIQNGQAFFMYANAANGDGTVTFPETAKVPDTTFITPFTRQGDGGTVNSLPGTGARVTGTQTPSIRTSLNTVNADGSTGSVVDQVLNQYDDSYSNSVDGYDGRKAANTGENLSINTTGTLLVVEKRHTIVGNDTIFLNLTSERVQAYQFNINASSLSTVDSGFIIDNYLNTRRQLNLKGNTKVNFNVVNVAGSYAANRFELVFVALKVLPSTIASVRAYQQSRGSTNINVDWSVSNEHGIQKYVVERSADSVTFTKLTVSKPTANDGSDVSYSVTDSKPLSGTNYYRIRMVDTLGNITYSVIVSVNIGAVKNNIEIYPNPVTDGKIHLQFSNEKAGKYGIRLLDKSGQVISEKQITRQEGNSTELLEWNYSIAHGIYQVEITRPDGSTKNINVLY